MTSLTAMTPEFTAFIDKVIAAIEEADPRLCEMSFWHRPVECGTAHCIGGWIDVVAGTPKISTTGVLQKLDPSVSSHQVDDLCYMWSFSLCQFDILEPEVRKQYMLRALTHFRDRGVADWHRVFGVAQEIE